MPVAGIDIGAGTAKAAIIRDDFSLTKYWKSSASYVEGYFRL